MALQCFSVLRTTLSSHLNSKTIVHFNRANVLRNNPRITTLFLNQNAFTFRTHTTPKNAFITNNKNTTSDTAGEHTHVEKTLKRKDFPPDFIFGASSAAIQIEGGDGTEGGRGPSSWDALLTDTTTGRPKGSDSFNLYKEDVKVLKEMGVDFYRFSISWPRILPDGNKKNVNKEGIKYYNSLLDELEKSNIKPMATLFHYDMPAALEEKYGGFSNRHIINDFKDYCDTCFEYFGDRIKHWITINEGYAFVVLAPFHFGTIETTDPTLQYIQTHNLLLAHATAAHSYKTKYQAKQGGEIGISLFGKWCEPLDPESPTDQAAVVNSFEGIMGWFMGPICKGDYPPQLKSFVVDLPEFTEEEKKLVKGSFDFLGVNYYTCSYATPAFKYSLTLEGHTKQESIAETNIRDGVSIGPSAVGAYPTYVYPEGLRKMLLYIKDHYSNPKIYITENGVPGKPIVSLSVVDARAVRKNEMVDIELNDDFRIDAIYGHIKAVHDAKKDGANVQGYFVWSLLDNNEFSDYPVRYGLTYIDWFDNCKRYPKKSAKWYGNFLHPIKPRSHKS